MDTTLITSTAAVLALGGFAIAECRARVWRRAAERRQVALKYWSDAASEAQMKLLNTRRELAERTTAADLETGYARQRELRLKRSQAALKGHQTRRHG